MCNVAVIGCGNMGQIHVRAYEALEEASLVAVCDPNIDHVQSAMKNDKLRHYSTVADMLEHEALDAVSICVPTSQHFDVATQCMDKNISVLVEKPIAKSMDEATALVAYAKQKNVTLTVGHIERFNPAILKAKAFIDNGHLGTIHAIHCKRYGPFPKQIKDADVMLDVAVHDIDIAQFLVNSTLVKTTTFTHHIHCDDRADYGHLMLKFEPNLMVNIHVSWAFPFKKREVEIIGDKGIAIIDCIKQSLSYYPVNVDKGTDYVALPVVDETVIEVVKKDPIIEECRSFLNAVKHNSPPFVCPEQATEALSLALSIPSHF